MPRRPLTKSEKKRARSFRLTDAEAKKLNGHAWKMKISQSRLIAKFITTL